jgi:pilus assembly protein CpaE
MPPAERFRVSILHGSGKENPQFREVLKDQPNLKFFQQALDPETFLSQHEIITPDLVVVDLDGMSEIPAWLGEISARLPESDIMVCSQCRDPDFLIRIMKLRVDAFVPLPLERHDLEEAVARVQANRLKDRGSEGHLSQLVVVTGTKGGVGTTSIAVNLGIALAEEMSGGVVLLDMARPFPQVGQFLNLKAEHTLLDLLHSADNLDPLFMNKIVQEHKSKLGVILSSPEFELGSPKLMDVRGLSKVFETLRTYYSWLLVDAGSWLDYVFVKQVQEADHVLLLTELTVPDLQNLKKIRGVFQRWDLDEAKVKVVVNRYEKDYTLGLPDIENIIFKPAFYTLPSDYASLIEAINQGVGLPEVAPRSKLWRRIKGLAGELIAQSKPREEARPGFLRRLFQKG